MRSSNDGPDREEIIEIIGESERLSTDQATLQLLDEYGGIDFMDPEGYGWMDTGPELVLQWMQENELVEPAIDMEQLVDQSFLDHANEQLGEYTPPS